MNHFDYPKSSLNTGSVQPIFHIFAQSRGFVDKPREQFTIQKDK